MQEKIDLSIVVPVYNEAQNIPQLYDRLSKVLTSSGYSYEIIMVDDGSTDGSLDEISRLSQKDSQVRALSFSRNFGHMIALSAGLDHASGEAVITMDADLQHPPELIPQLLQKWKAGAEVVNTIRKDTRGNGLLKKATAGMFYWLMRRIANIDLIANSADYRLLDRKVVDNLKKMKERSRFLRGMISWVGFRQEFIEYAADARVAGRTKYSFSKMLAFALDGITAFSAFPLRLAMYLGFIIAGLSALYILYAVYIRLFTARAISGWASVLIAVLFIGGTQLIFLGIIGEYLSRVYEESKERPLYIINKKIGL